MDDMEKENAASPSSPEAPGSAPRFSFDDLELLAELLDDPLFEPAPPEEPPVPADEAPDEPVEEAAFAPDAETPEDEQEPEPEPAPSRAATPQRARKRRSLPNVLGLFPLCLFLFLVVAFGLMNLLTPDKELSESENRLLAQRPRLTMSALSDSSYFDDLDSWYADQFFNRDGWISRNLKGQKLLGRHESNGVYLGSDGYLFSKPEPLNEALVEEKTDAMRAFASSYSDIPMYTAIVPSSAAVLSDKLPENAPVEDQLADISVITSALSSSIDCIDMASALLQHRTEYIFYKTDHHWTSLGAYYAFSSMLGHLGITEPCSYQVYTVAADFEGTLSAESGSHSETDVVDIYVPTTTDVMFYVNYLDKGEKSRSLYVSAALENKDKYTVFFGGNHPLIEIATTCNNDRVLLVFKDSYANCFMQFLTPYYEKIFMIDPRYYYGDLRLLMSSENVTDVLFLYSADTFMTDTSLTDVLVSALEA